MYDKYTEVLQPVSFYKVRTGSQSCSFCIIVSKGICACMFSGKKLRWV